MVSSKLLFLILLGFLGVPNLSQAIAQEHQEAINYLTSVMNIEVSLLIDMPSIFLSAYTDAGRTTF